MEWMTGVWSVGSVSFQLCKSARWTACVHKDEKQTITSYNNAVDQI